MLALFLFIGAFHLHVALTVGDWDFWLDWKDRQWWPLVTPLMMITFPASVQAVLWTNFRLPLGATLCVSCLLIGTWITRIFAYHYWTYFPINMVLPATMMPSALVLDVILMLSNSLTVTSIFGGMSFALLFYPRMQEGLSRSVCLGCPGCFLYYADCGGGCTFGPWNYSQILGTRIRLVAGNHHPGRFHQYAVVRFGWAFPWAIDG